MLDHFFDHAKTTDLAAITREQVIAWKDSLVASGLSGSTIAKVHLTTLKRIFAWALVNARIGLDPSAGVKVAKPKKIKVREQGFSLEEAETILTAIALFTSQVCRVGVIRAPWRDLSLLLRHDLLQQAGTYLLAGTAPDTSEPCLYNGEGGSLPSRLPDHRRNSDLAFVETVYILASDSFEKSDVIYLQERLSTLIQQAGTARLVQGCGPTSQPISAAKAAELDLVLHFGLQLLEHAGCRGLESLPSVLPHLRVA